MYSRKRNKSFLNEIWWDNEYNKKAYSYIVLAICIVILLVIGGFKLNSDIQKNIATQKEYNRIMHEKAKEQEEKELKRKQEYKKWKANPNNAYEYAKKQAKLKQEKEEYENQLSENYYKIGDRLIIMSNDTIIEDKTSQFGVIRDRIGTDIIRNITESGLIVGDKGVYIRDEIRKPTSNTEFREISKLELEGKLNK